MDIYHTAYEEFGRETYEMWRAARLVIDTGLHHKAGRARRRSRIWPDVPRSASTRLKPKSTATSRAGPGAQLQTGEMKIVELRARAEKELGAKFDLRAFHDAILAEGSVPLPLLEQRIDAWIATSGKPKS